MGKKTAGSMAYLDEKLHDCASQVEAALAERIEQTGAAERLKQAMGYGALGGGKRVRPFLLIETARLFGAAERALGPALALECVHCYSLAHDDLPAMDDDDLRRGRPSLHKAFDEATAILAGDALQTLAFEIIAADQALSDQEKYCLTLGLARASGGAGMAGGQMLDLQAEGRFATNGQPLALSPKEILHLQALKTGALFRFACKAGAILGGASEAETTALLAYADAFGKAFQISDDLLDAEGTSETIGKTAGKDAAQGKATLVGLWGIEETRNALKRTLDEGHAALARFGAKADVLTELLDFLGGRKS